MRFGIIHCLKCHRALGFELRFRKTTCPYCNTRFSIDRGIIKFKTDSEKDLGQMISKLNKDFELSHGLEDKYTFELDSGNTLESNEDSKPQFVYEQLDPIKRIAIKFKNEPESLDLVRMLALNLGTELGEFTLEVFQDLLNECNIDIAKAEKYLDKFKELTIIYEPRTGIYKVVED